MNITRVEPLLLSVPAPRRRVSLTDPRPAAGADVLAVRLHTDTEHVGLGFATAPAAGLALRSLIETELAPLVTGEDPVGHEALFSRAAASARAVRWGGFARAYSAIDLAVWDQRKTAGTLHRLLGGVQSSAPGT